MSEARAKTISAVISDVDGTLVTTEKILTAEARDAVKALRARGIPFAIVSSRPPRGMEGLVEALEITTPVTGFNGGMIVTPDMKTVLETHTLSPDVASRAVEMLKQRGITPWVFNGRDWLIQDRAGPHVEHEIHTVGFQPTLTKNFEGVLDQVGKIVGASDAFDELAKAGEFIRDALGAQATVALSQRYYLDMTHPLANKGNAVTALAKLLNVPVEEIAVIGDGENDIAMFKQAGFSIAMGNASEEVRSHASVVTVSNQENGFSLAVRRHILKQ